MQIRISNLNYQNIPIISEAFKQIEWNKPVEQYERYLKEQEAAQRIVLVAWQEEVFVGYVTVVWESLYPPFRNQNIPEIVDLNVLPDFQKQGIGTQLMDEAEKIIAQKSNRVGIGVGLAPGYNQAQRLYVKRGYIPDGMGVTYQYKPVQEGQVVSIDDTLELHLIKSL